MAKVFASTFIEAPIVEVWKIIRNFNTLPEWHPAISSSRIEENEPDDKIGCIRNFTFEGGGTIREKLLELSDSRYSVTYSMLESQLPIECYVSTLRLLPISDKNCCYVEWTAEFCCKFEEEKKLTEMVKNDVFYSGFNGLKNKLKA